MYRMLCQKPRNYYKVRSGKDQIIPKFTILLWLENGQVSATIIIKLASSYGSFERDNGTIWRSSYYYGWMGH